MSQKLIAGAKMPNFTFNTGYKTGLTMEEVAKKAEKTVIWVVRYMGCPPCRLDAQLISERYAEFQAKGAQVLVMMQSDQAHIQAAMPEDFPVEIISDPSMEIYKELEIKPAESMETLLPKDQMHKFADKLKLLKKYGYEHGDYEGDEQQLPAQFIIDKDCNVLYAHYATNMVDMNTIDDMLALLDSAKKLNAGDKFPNFLYKTGWESGKYLHDALKNADKTVVWVLRYIGCTTCRYDVHITAQRYEEYKAKNAQVIFVMQSDQAHIANEFKEERLPFDLICDDEQNIYHQLVIEAAESKEQLGGADVFKEKMANKRPLIQAAGFAHGDYEGNELQFPAMFILNADGTVAYSHYATAIGDMPNTDEILAML